MEEELDPRKINFSQATVPRQYVWDPTREKIRVVVFDENEISDDNRRLDSALEAEVNPLKCDVIDAAAPCSRRHTFAFNSSDANGIPCVWMCECYPVNYGSCINIRCAQNDGFPLRGQLQRPQEAPEARQRVCS